MNAFITRLEANFSARFPRLSRHLMPYRTYVFYLFSGGTAAFVDISLIFVFTELFGWWYLLSAVAAFAVAVVVSFILQKFLTFRDFAVAEGEMLRQSLVYFAVALVNLGLNTTLMYLFVERGGLHYLISQVIAGALVAVVSFLVYRYLIFQPNRQFLGERRSGTIPDMHQVKVIIANTLSVFFRSFLFLGPVAWIKFWCLFPERHEVTLSGRRVAIRSRRTAEKIVDLFMAASCILDEQYSKVPGFSIGRKDTVLDIGGHIGSFSLYAAAKAPEGTIILFEPSRSNFPGALENIRLNGFTNIRAHNLAVFGQSGSLRLYEDDLNSAKNSLVRKTDRFYDVEAVTLDEIFSRFNLDRCDFLKLDCEGSEYEILFGASSRLLGRIERMVIEVHTPSYFGITDPRYTEENLIAFLEEYGFEVTRVFEDMMHNLLFARRKTT